MRGRRRSGPPAEPVRLSDVAIRAPSRAERYVAPSTQHLALQSSDGLILTVTAIEKQERRRRYNVFVNGEFALALDPEVLAGSGLAVDKPVAAERLRELSVEDLRKRALDGALRLLAARPRSEQEVRERLTRRGLPHDVIVHAIERLREYGYVNDTEFARFWVEARSGANPRGRFVVRRELRQKGVAQETADEAMESLTETRSARKAARQKVGTLRGLEYPDFRNRLAGYLARRGFGWDVIKPVVNDAWKEQHGEPPEDDAAWEEQ
jgi:regulatory protein